MSADLLKKREREIREQDREERDRKMADIVKNLTVSMNWTVSQACKNMGLSAEDQARVSRYLS